MPVFQNAKQQAEQEVLVNLLTRLSEDPTCSQRSLASEMGVALGMISNYLKRCIKKGYVRAKEISPRRFGYFVTPEGFIEKSQLVIQYLSDSMAFFKEVRNQLESLFSRLEQAGLLNIAVIGPGDIAEMAERTSRDLKVSAKLVGIEADLNGFDAILITDTQNPQVTYETLKKHYACSKILTLPVLCIVRERIVEPNAVS